MIKNCEMCKSTPTVSQYKIGAGSGPSNEASIICQCGLSVIIRGADTGWDVSESQWNQAMSITTTTWNRIND